MAKRIEVVLNKTVNKLGRSGDLVPVAPGYARNFLIPQGLAQVATPGLIRQVEQRREKERQLKIAEKEAAIARKTALATIGRFVIKKQEGEDGAIFGTVTTQDVAASIEASTSQTVDRRDITVPDISSLGVYTCEVKLHPEVTAEVQIQVSPL
ncbi:MAG: 50S ribosomal protein L9 [Cyanobacteria bacterium P01_H01_bin.15]